MKKLLIAVVVGVVGVPVVGCTQETIIKKVPAPETQAEPDPEPEPTPGSQPGGGSSSSSGGTADGGKKEEPPPPGQATADNCLDGQDMDAADVDVSKCPAIPEIPADVKVGTKAVSLGAWELGTTSNGETYKYGTLSAPTANPRTLEYDGGTATVNAGNLECWAKGYYRLRKILQNAPVEWVALKDAGFQFRFFQFQTDLRNGPTGYKGIASFQDHLVKWVTVISAQGVCQQPTLSKFKSYAKSELTRRGLPVPNGT